MMFVLFSSGFVFVFRRVFSSVSVLICFQRAIIRKLVLTLIIFTFLPRFTTVGITYAKEIQMLDSENILQPKSVKVSEAQTLDSEKPKSVKVSEAQTLDSEKPKSVKVSEAQTLDSENILQPKSLKVCVSQTVDQESLLKKAELTNPQLMRDGKKITTVDKKRISELQDVLEVDIEFLDKANVRVKKRKKMFDPAGFVELTKLKDWFGIGWELASRMDGLMEDGVSSLADKRIKFEKQREIRRALIDKYKDGYGKLQTRETEREIRNKIREALHGLETGPMYENKKADWNCTSSLEELAIAWGFYNFYIRRDLKIKMPKVRGGKKRLNTRPETEEEGLHLVHTIFLIWDMSD